MGMNGDLRRNLTKMNGDLRKNWLYMNGDLRYTHSREEELYMSRPVFKRKIYNEILEWKVNRSDKYALLIKGARRVGKSTIAEEFAKNEFKSYILIDFANTSRAIIDLFDEMICMT